MRTSLVPSASSWIPAAPPGSSSAAAPPEMMIRPMNSARTLLILFLLTILAIDRTLCLPVQAAQSAIQEQRNQRCGRGWSTRYNSDQLLPSRTSSSSSSRVDEPALSNLLHPVLPAIRRSFQITEKDSRARRRRVLTVVQSSSSSEFRPLAPKSDRIDPLDHFRKYKDGYNLKSKHYWASVIFTGIYGYAIAAAWTILGLLLSLIACCKYCLRLRGSSNSRYKRPHDSSGMYWIPGLVISILSAIAIGCGVVLYIASKECKDKAYNVEDVILEAAQNATNSITTVSSKLASVQATLQPYSSPSFVTSVNSIETTLNKTAANVQSKVLVNKKTYKRIVQIIWIVLLVIISTTLFLIICGLASTFLRWTRFFSFIIVVTWILTTMTWLTFGILFATHNVVSDTCLSLQEYLQNPVNTTLNTVLPCAALAAANATYRETRIDIDSVIRTQNKTFMAYAQGITSLTGLCDPIGPAPDYSYTGICPNNTLPLGDLQEVIAPLVCNETSSTGCGSGQVITKKQNDSFTDLSNAGQTILDTFPLLDGLTNCSFVTNTVSIIVTQQCKPVNTAINHLWIAFVVMSSLLVFLIAFWDIANRLNAEQHYLVTIIPQDTIPYNSGPYSVIVK
ncbi:unnamed protein product [Sphagnum tenellum]